MKIALVHDQLQEFGGAERVLVALKEIFPEDGKVIIWTIFKGYNITNFSTKLRKQK